MRIAIAMGGGVYSSVTAVLLKKLGYDIMGITLNILHQGNMGNSMPLNKSYIFPENIIFTKRIAKLYDFKHEILNIEEDFSRKIINPFCSEYLNGKTPSPRINCNPKIKKLIDFARFKGFDKIATGHYANITKSKKGRFYISMGLEKEKDQSYFLFMLSQNMLEYLHFPLGSYYTNTIHKMAINFNLPETKSTENQETCFFVDNDCQIFFKKKTPPFPNGDILDNHRNVIGKHRGIHKYSIGQGNILDIPSEHPLYVTEIDSQMNIIVAGPKEDLYCRGLYATYIHYMRKTNLNGISVYVKISPTHELVEASLKDAGNGIYVYFDEPQIGVNPGQSAVFYNGSGDILGGALIVKGFK